MANIMRLGGGGKKAEGEIPITANGIYDVAEYASANVNVQSAPVLLWTNASPTSGFAAQTVTLGGDWDGFIVEIKYDTAISIEEYGRGLGLFMANGNEYGAACVLSVASNRNGVQARKVTNVTRNSIVFGVGYRANANDTGATYAIPTRIWGVKFTL